LRLIIIGGGQVGTELAKRLSKEHDVVVIERNSNMAKIIESSMDVMVIRGSGASVRTLEKAGISEAKLLIAVTEIDEVNIRGNDHFSNWRIRRQIQSRVSRIFRRRYYYPEMVHRDITQIIRFYHDHGFLDVEVDKEVETDEEQRTAAISFHIREGDQYYWDDLKIYGNTLFTDSEVQNQLQQLQQETFSYSLWYRQDASRIFNLYANEGFLDTEVETDFIRNDNKVDLVVHIDEGIRHEVSDIQIIRPPLDLDDLGFWEKLSLIISPPVEEDIIRKYFRVQEGDIYKKHQVERGYYNLMNSNLFERVQLRGEPTPFQQETVPYFAQTLPGALGEEVPEEPDKRDIQIELDEKATGHLMLSAGYGEDIGVFGQIRLREENFRGRGHTLSLAGTFASKYHSVHGSYYIPFFRGRTDQSLLTEMYSSLYQRPEYDETRRGIEFEVGNEISDYLRWYWGAKLAQVSMDLDSGVERGIDISTNTYDHIQDYERYYLAGPTIGIREDTRDSHTFPTSGYRQQYELNLLGAFGGEFLPNISGDFRWFYPITEDYIWANNLAMDWTMRDVDSIPLPERNYLGGSRTVRGYAFRGIIPKDPLEDDLALGGSGRFLVKTEVRRRFTENFSLAAFLDGGVLGHSHLMDWDDPWKFGTGLQFAFHLPIGDISIDVAHALNPDRRDDRQTIHFNLGFNF